MNDGDASLDLLFRVLSDPTRRAILHSLGGEEKTIGELVAPYRMTFAAASKHIRILEQAGLATRRIVGAKHLVRANPVTLLPIRTWIDHYLSVAAAGR